MKEMNSLETQLRSWMPRRPSARLKRKLFGASHKAAWLFGSLAPATGCALLTLAIFSSRNGISSGSISHELTVASNWNGAAFVSEGFADKQNHWSSITFDWTNHSGLGSSMPSFRHAN